MELLQSTTGARFTHIPYKSSTAALVDLISGNIEAMFDFVVTSAPHIKSGKVVPLAVTSAKRLPALPDVPTMAEAGYPQYAVSVWYGVAAQSKLPDEIAQKLKASLDRALSDDTFRASLDKSGFAPLRPKSFADIDKFIDADRKLWAGVIKELNISLD